MPLFSNSSNIRNVKYCIENGTWKTSPWKIAPPSPEDCPLPQPKPNPNPDPGRNLLRGNLPGGNFMGGNFPVTIENIH